MGYDSHSGSFHIRDFPSDRSLPQPETGGCAARLLAAKREGPKAARPTPGLVGGFKVPENLRYHPGHTWALSESPSLVRVGMDDFASKLVGKVERMTLPQRGQWIRQGQKIATIFRDGAAVDMVSPIEGSIADVNDHVSQDPKLAQKDPYGEGWLVTVQSPDAKTNFRNLLGGALARWWTEESAGRLQKKMPMFVARWHRTAAWRWAT